MRYRTKVILASSSAIIAAILWIIGDVLIVGFKPQPELYPIFSETYANQVDVQMAVYMLESSTDRLMAGALIAVLSLPFYLPGVWMVLQSFKNKKSFLALSSTLLLLIGYVLSPLGHAAFFYVGEAYKAIINTNETSHPYLLNMASSFKQILDIMWGSSVAASLSGWLLLMAGMVANRTQFPRWMVVSTPPIVVLLLVQLTKVAPDGISIPVTAAAMNIANLVFYMVCSILLLRNFENHDPLPGRLSCT